jgi:membrane protein YqaA with SNARE-associated domain
VDPAQLIGPEASLWSLAVAAFLAATVLPLSSEVALFGVLKLYPHLFWPAIAVATVANTLGGMTSYLIGRFLAARKPLKHV